MSVQLRPGELPRDWTPAAVDKACAELDALCASGRHRYIDHENGKCVWCGRAVKP